MSDSKTKLQLWSIQTVGAYQELRRTGVLSVSGDHIDPSFARAYRWMGSELERRVAKPPGFTGSYPVWAWFQYDGLHRKKPRLRDAGLLEPGSKGVLLDLIVEPELVLLSDFQKWHAVLNEDYLPIDSCDQDAFDDWVSSADDSEEMKRLVRDRVEASWSRIFDVEARASDCWEGPEKREIQAVLWQIEATMVSSVEGFVAVSSSEA